jgi:hypothetical protein
MTHARTSGMLPENHRDPFDRLLIAQALLDKLTLVSNEALFEQFGVGIFHRYGLGNRQDIMGKNAGHILNGTPSIQYCWRTSPNIS